MTKSFQFDITLKGKKNQKPKPFLKTQQQKTKTKNPKKAQSQVFYYL